MYTNTFLHGCKLADVSLFRHTEASIEISAGAAHGAQGETELGTANRLSFKVITM